MMFYRLRQWYHATNFKYRTRILSSPPIACQPDAACAIHTMLSQRDLPLYLVAIKSFLHWYPNVAVVVHSDGTLRDRESSLLLQHVPGCRVVSINEANALATRALGAESLLFQCREWDASYRRLIDTELFHATTKRIIMDSDILVLRHPTQVIDWIERGEGPFLMGQPPRAKTYTRQGSTSKHIQTIFQEHLTALGQKLGLPNEFFDGTTGGFHGCGERELSFVRIERLLRACEEVGIDMKQWGGEQCIIIYLLSTAGASRLSTDLYINFDFHQVDKVKSAHVVHFLGYCRYYKDLYPSLAAEVVKELTRSSTVPV